MYIYYIYIYITQSKNAQTDENRAQPLISF